MKHLFFFIAIVILHFSLTISGQVFYSDTKVFTVNDGLSQSRITALFQDSRGFIWIGTEDGLNRFDGYTFVNYYHEAGDTNSISGSCINAIGEDKEGILWIATNKGLNSFDIRTNLFTHYIHDKNNSNTLSSTDVLNVYIDAENTLWAKTFKSLDRFNPKAKTFQRHAHYTDPARIASLNLPYPVYEDKQNRLWIGTKDGLSFFDRELQLFNRYISLEYNPKSLSHDEVLSILEDREGMLWIGTDYGLNAFYPSKKEFKRYYLDLNPKDMANCNHINTLLEDNSGLLWVGTTGGLYIFDRHTAKFNEVTGPNTSFTCPTYSIIRDKSGCIWVGTLKGLIKINTQLAKFKLYRSATYPANANLTSNDIGSLYSLDPSTLMVGTWEKGLNIFNRKTGEVRAFDFSKQGIKHDNCIHYIYETRPDKYFLGTDNGILVFNPVDGAYHNLSNDTIRGSEFLLQKRVNSILKDKQGNFWFGTLSGLYMYNVTRQEIKSYVNNPSDNNSLCDNNIHGLAIDYKENIWIGTGNGLDMLNFKTEAFTHYTDNPRFQPYISNSTVFCLQFDYDGVLWVGTASGLNKFDIKNNSVKIITKKDGLSDNLIYAILFDKKQNAWVSTNHGINVIDYKTGRIRSFDVNDGLQDREFKLNAACKSKEDELFFGGVSGINAIHPDALGRNNNIPKVVITSIEAITADGKGLNFNPYSNTIIIPHETHSFSIYFAALDYTFPQKNNFAYIFSSSKDSNWINLGNKHWVTFSDLKPGEYKFRVKGSNNDLVWNENGISVTIEIASPFWLKADAYYLYIFMFFMLFFGFYRFRSYRLRKSDRIHREREITARQVEQQKELLAVKNRNITDSINYAKRIQEALMPSEKNFKKILPESFVFHQPKDIVSGDFFWVSERGSKIYVAAVDCTGHGVPGAFMSIIGFELFRNITHTRGVDDPSQILNILNHEFEEIFRDVENFTFKDGMDIAFCVIDKKTRILEFSGAVNPIYLIRDNKITEIRGSRFSVGLDDNCEEEQTFENKQIVLQEDDMFYLFSDGYADQFGGTEGKKFKYRRFRHLLLTIHQYTIEEQKRLLEERINRWKGDLEQVDDILVIGFRPKFNNF